MPHQALQPPITALRTAVPIGIGQQMSDRDHCWYSPLSAAASGLRSLAATCIPRPLRGDFSRGRALHQHVSKYEAAEAMAHCPARLRGCVLAIESSSVCQRTEVAATTRCFDTHRAHIDSSPPPHPPRQHPGRCRCSCHSPNRLHQYLATKGTEDFHLILDQHARLDLTQRPEISIGASGLN